MVKKIKEEKVSHCLICNSPSLVFLHETKTPAYIRNVDITKFKIVKCAKCDFMFINPRPISKHIPHYYPDTCANFYKSKTNLLDKIFSLFTNEAKKKGVKKERMGAILDIGFGAGEYLINKYNEGWKCYGLDISEYAYKKLKKSNPKLNLVNADLINSGFSDNMFDFVHMSAVLEHVPQPLENLKEIYRILKPGGTAFIMVPNQNGLYYRLAKQNAQLLAPQHLVFFTKSTLIQALKIAGFTNINISTDFGNLTSLYLLEKLGLNSDLYQKSLLKQILGVFVYIIEKSFNIGDVLIVKVKK